MTGVADSTLAVYDMKVSGFQGDSINGSQIILVPNWERAEEGWQVILPLEQGLKGLKGGDKVKLHIERYD